MTLAAGSGALSGVRVLDLGQGISGPFAARLLGDFGADVIKAEPAGGDQLRRAGPMARPPSVKATAAGPSQGSISAAWYS